MSVYQDFGFDEVRVKFSDRPAKRAGSDATWDKAEGALKAAVEAAGLEYTLNPGEGAFYGPKLEFVLRDAIGRDWQCGTLQVDFVLPERLGAEYVGEDGAVAPAGHAAPGHPGLPGAFFRDSHRKPRRKVPDLAGAGAGRGDEYYATGRQITSRRATEFLKNQGLRVEMDLRNEKVGFKIREHTLQRVPYLLVAGDRESGSNSLAVRTRSGKDLGAMPLETLASKLAEEVASRGRTVLL